jgi:lipopolysaccharide transport system ATP-binding protein
MTSPIISVEGLSKVYLVGHSRPKEHYLRDQIVREARTFARKTADFVRGKQIVQGDDVEEFWALNDVSFDVKEGEVLGIIGRNGAGKSTLLKILSRITDPTRGRVRLKGRVASLLEVGTGFHPELSGRENIFLNGAILGMGRHEILRKFDEIVAFAEVEKFLDTPVKRYSSGMYVRLAFAVAAHLEPEILIVDEVLAVGDAEFQRKCLGKIDAASRQDGRTVIFVSHNMSAVSSLCSRSIYLHQGHIKECGDAKSIVASYLSARSERGGEIELGGNANSDNRPFRFRRAAILDCDRNISSKLTVTQPFHVFVEYQKERDVASIELVVRIETDDGCAVFSATHSLSDLASDNSQRGGRSVEVPPMFLMPGTYFLTIAAHTPMVELHDQHEQVLSFEVVDNGSPFSKYGNYRKIGVVMVDFPWNIGLISSSLSKLEK